MPVVWRAEAHEAETVGSLLVAFRDHLGYGWPSENSIIASVERLISTRDCEYFLAAAGPDDPPAGVAQVRFRWSIWMAAEDALLEDLYVRESARRHGLGRALVEAVYERARERGCRRIELDVERENHAARSLYESSGFALGDLYFARRRIWENLPDGAPLQRPKP